MTHAAPSPHSLASADRAQLLARLARERFDVVIVGGGATGAASARDAALRGLKTALVERGDFASQTSSASSQLIHGGIRYLQYGNFGLVFEGLAERRRLMRAAPHLCRPVDFVFPGYAGTKPSLGTIGLGIRLYNLLALGRPPSKRERLSPERLGSLAPRLRRDGLQGAQVYQDCQTDDARLVLENVLDAESAGAVCLNHVEASPWRRDERGFSISVRDRLHEGAPFEVHGRMVVNATGPFSDAYAGTRKLRPTLGVHVVLPAERLPTAGRVFVLNAPRDGRLFFVIPAGARTYVGTTDTDWQPPRDTTEPGRGVHARRSDVDYLLEAANAAFPEARLTHADVISTWAGLRPLVASQDDTPSATSREHEIDFEAGALTITGGKLTTMRKMAEETVDRLVAWGARRGLSAIPRACRTRTRALPGGGAWTALPEALPEEVRTHLHLRYGSRAEAVARLALSEPDLAQPLTPDLPELWAEAVFAIDHERAETVEDVLRRRLSMFRYARDQGLEAAPRVAALLAAKKGSSPQTQSAWIEAYARAVASTRSWKEE
ncbi:MAG: glycerol-3-phosphate dehydrogenase/oxidase [Myxococcales bacterium]|nr:glycerol-3-phosphate dehydrogenase/oxidase [Myxococcales bacterium]